MNLCQSPYVPCDSYYDTFYLTEPGEVRTQSFCKLFEVHMALTSIGSQSSDQPKTPTLRQFYKQHGTAPNRSHVKTIFFPNRLPYYTLITDHNFKVVVSEDNPLHGVITDGMEEWATNQVHLVVVVEDGEKGSWSLSIDTDENSDYEEMAWGYRVSLVKKTQPNKKRTKLTHDRTTQNGVA